MEFWSELVASGDIVNLLAVLIIVIATGGVGAAIVNGISTNRRGVRGDALVREQNGITGLDTLTKAQAAELERVAEQRKADKDEAQKNLEKVEEKLNARIDELEEDLRREAAYVTALVEQLITHQLAPVPRPPIG